jgi:hypothetical protein
MLIHLHCLFSFPCLHLNWCHFFIKVASIISWNGRKTVIRIKTKKRRETRKKNQADSLISDLPFAHNGPNTSFHNLHNLPSPLEDVICHGSRQMTFHLFKLPFWFF